MKEDKTVIKVGDTVKIINPEIVTYVGYDFTIDEAMTKMKEEHVEKVNQLMRDMGISFLNKRWEKIASELMKPLAYELVRASFKRNNERKIHFKLREDLANSELIVISKKTAKTGFYYPPHFGGDDDYEPGGLKDPKTHVLLELGYHRRLSNHDEGMLIEQRNVIKVI